MAFPLHNSICKVFHCNSPYSMSRQLSAVIVVMVVMLESTIWSCMKLVWISCEIYENADLPQVLLPPCLMFLCCVTWIVVNVYYLPAAKGIFLRIETARIMPESWQNHTLSCCVLCSFWRPAEVQWFEKNVWQILPWFKIPFHCLNHPAVTVTCIYVNLYWTRYFTHWLYL
jgi:hypothetical protein